MTYSPTLQAERELSLVDDDTLCRVNHNIFHGNPLSGNAVQAPVRTKTPVVGIPVGSGLDACMSPVRRYSPIVHCYLPAENTVSDNQYTAPIALLRQLYKGLIRLWECNYGADCRFQRHNL